MNEIVNKFLLAGNKFMPEMHLMQPALLDKLRFNYSALKPFTKNTFFKKNPWRLFDLPLSIKYLTPTFPLHIVTSI